jgi:hypothetical protein
MPAGDLQRLHGLLRLSPDTPIERLRAAYEQAMREATRAGDHQRALALSSAFDALPAGTRAQVYRNARNSEPVAARPIGSPSGRARAVRRTRRLRRQRRPRRRGAVLVRVLAYGLGIPAIVLGGYYAATHDVFASAGDQGGQQPFVIHTQPAPPPVDISPPTTGFGPSLRLPADAPVDANGAVTVACQPDDGTAGYLISAPPGTVVACSNGAVPVVVG